MTKVNTENADAMRRALDHALAYRDSVLQRPIPPQIDPAEAERRLGGDLGEEPTGAVDVINDMVAKADAGLLQFTSPGFFGYVIGASHPVGVAADLLVSTWGQNTAYAVTTPAVVAMENAVCGWVVDMLGLPPESGVGIVTGATLANTTAVMAARNALLRRANWDVEGQGLFGAPEVHVVIGKEAHSAVFAALRYAGFGSERVHTIDTDDQGRMLVDDFSRVMDGLNGPTLVILQAGHINSGAFDPVAPLIEIAHKKQAWVHVDGAFGLWVRAVPELADRLAGVDAADSWAVDLHKWLNAPYDAGMVIVRDKAALVASMSARGAYLPEIGASWDPSEFAPELSRRARGVPSYAILRMLGRSGVREMITRHCRFARDVGLALSQIDGITVMSEPTSNQVAFRCGEGTVGDAMTHAVLSHVQQKGRVYPSHANWHGREIIRISISGHATAQTEIDTLLHDVGEAWEHVRQEGAANDI